MTDMSQGPDWWIASDGRWYPPHLHPAVLQTPSSPQSHAAGGPSTATTAGMWAPSVSEGVPRGTAATAATYPPGYGPPPGQSPPPGVGVIPIAYAQDPAAGEGGAPQPAPAGGKAAPSPAQLSQLCRIDIKGDKKDQWMRLPTALASVTQHRLSLGGKSLEYTATAGTLIVRDDEDRPIASIGYIAYTRRDGKSGVARPITFAFNGGPGSSSMWLHMGVLGPKRVLVSEDRKSVV